MNNLRRSRQTGRRPSIPELINFATDYLNVDYIFWCTEEPYYSTDLIPFMDGFTVSSKTDEGSRPLNEGLLLNLQALKEQMKMGSQQSSSPLPFPFILDEVAPLRPTVKRIFGNTNVYVGDRLLFSLRNDLKRTGTNGMWLYTDTENVASLAREFPDLPRRQIWRSGKNCWIVLAARLECFEEYALKACDLILDGDRRIGRISRRSRESARIATPGLFSRI